MKNTFALGVAAACALSLVGCGANSAKKVFALEAADLQSELASQSTSEAMSAAAAGDAEGSTGLSLALADSESPYKTMTRSCEVQADGSAKVTIASEIAFEKTLKTARISRVNSLSGNSLETRLWSRSGGSVACGSDNQHAAVNWNTDITGLALKVDVNRTRSHVMTQTNLVKNVTMSRSRSFSMTGAREVSFVSHSSNGTNITVVKNVSGQLQKAYNFIDKNGQTQSGSLALSGAIQVKVIRLASDKSLVSREIVSGTRTSTAGDGSKVEAAYTNFLIAGEGELCAAQSGSFVLKYVSSSGALEKTVSCAAEDGALSCSDADGGSVEVESPSCDPIDAR